MKFKMNLVKSESVSFNDLKDGEKFTCTKMVKFKGMSLTKVSMDRGIAKGRYGAAFALTEEGKVVSVGSSKYALRVIRKPSEVKLTVEYLAETDRDATAIITMYNELNNK
jgi:hypothetical protein